MPDPGRASPPPAAKEESSFAAVAAAAVEVPLGDGEHGILVEGLEEDEKQQTNISIGRGIGSGRIAEKDSSFVFYGSPLSTKEAAERMDITADGKLMPEKGKGGTSRLGLIYYATLIPDQFVVNGKIHRALNPRDFDSEKCTIKPRRPALLVTASDFFSSITKINGKNGPRYIFHGMLNGWPSLRCLELVAIEGRRNGSNVINDLPTAKEIWSGQILFKKLWTPSVTNSVSLLVPPSDSSLVPSVSASDSSSSGVTQQQQQQQIQKQHHHRQPQPKQQFFPSLSLRREEVTAIVEPQSRLQPNQVYRLTLRGAPWTSKGWSKASTGFCFWYHAQQKPNPTLSFGQDLLRDLDDGTMCTRVHMVSHRYAYARRETPRDRFTYHSIVFVEWDHGQYGTIMEAAFLNGIGGYRGKSNWYADRDTLGGSRLSRCLPSEMLAPWRTSEAEIRCFDISARNLNELKTYIHQYRQDGDGWNDDKKRNRGEKENPSNTTSKAASATASTTSTAPPDAVGTVRKESGRFVDPQYTFSHDCRLTFRSQRHLGQYLLNYISRDTSYGELSRNCQTFAADLCNFLAGKNTVVPFHPVNRIDYTSRTHLFLYDSSLYDGR